MDGVLCVAMAVPPSSFLRLQYIAKSLNFSILDDLSVLHVYTDNYFYFLYEKW